MLKGNLCLGDLRQSVPNISICPSKRVYLFIRLLPPASQINLHSTTFAAVTCDETEVEIDTIVREGKMSRARLRIRCSVVSLLITRLQIKTGGVKNAQP